MCVAVACITPRPSGTRSITHTVTMNVVRLANRSAIESYLRQAADLDVYALADLDDFFWPHSTWYGQVNPATAAIEAVCLILGKVVPPVVYAVCPPGHRATGDLLRTISGSLPDTFHATRTLASATSSGALTRVGSGRSTSRCRFRDRGPQAESELDAAATPAKIGQLVSLGVDDGDEVCRFYAEGAYSPGEDEGRFFDPYLLELGPCYGIRAHQELVRVGGVHVNSMRYGVAAIGNVATGPQHRGHGHATRAAEVDTTDAALAIKEERGRQLADAEQAAAGRRGNRAVGVLVASRCCVDPTRSPDVAR